jgi:hypothetical protein
MLYRSQSNQPLRCCLDKKEAIVLVESAETEPKQEARCLYAYCEEHAENHQKVVLKKEVTFRSIESPAIPTFKSTIKQSEPPKKKKRRRRRRRRR